MPKRLTPAGEAAPPVEPINTGATLPPKESVPKKRQTRPRKNEAGIVYVRNIHHIQARVTLNSGREIHLQPRGQREDLDIINREEQEDPKFLANKDLVFEVISVEAAKEIIAKQQTNSGRQQQTLWDHLRNEKGESYEQRHATIEEAYERQGVVVGHVDTPRPDGTTASQNIGYHRAGPTIVEAPGSPGHPATELMQSVPSGISPEEYHEFLLWKQFKEQKALEAQRSAET